MPAEVVIEATTLRLARPSVVAVARRIAARFQRRIADGLVNLYAQGATAAVMIEENWDVSV